MAKTSVATDIPTDPELELRAAVAAVTDRVPAIEGYPQYYLLRAIAAALVQIVKILSNQKGKL